MGLHVLGPPCPAFKPAHNLPHRTRLLEALAHLDLSQRHAPGDPTSPPAEKARPSTHDPDTPAASRPAHTAGPGQADILIWAGRGTGLPAPHAYGRNVTTVLGAADFDQYITDPTTLEELGLTPPPPAPPPPSPPSPPSPSPALIRP